MVFDQGDGSDILVVLEAEWSEVEPLGIDAQEAFLKGVLDRVSVVTESDRNALERFLVEKFEIWENEFCQWAEAKDRRRDDRVRSLEAEWETREDDSDRQRFLQQILQDAVEEEDMCVANLFVKPKDLVLWQAWAKPLEEWELVKARQERMDVIRQSRGRFIG